MTKKRKAEIVLSIVAVTVFVCVVIDNKFPATPPIPPEHEIIPFESIKQPDSISCGPTSTTMVLRYLGHKVDLKDVKKVSKTKWLTVKGKEIGMTAPDLILQTLRHYEVKAHMYSNAMGAEILLYVSQGRPCIVLLRSGPLLWHYVVVIGYTKDKVIIANPGSGEREEMASQAFLRAWEFKADMNGDSVKPQCFVCGGSGRIGKWNLGPINRCDVCGGSGFLGDMASVGLRWLEVSPCTIIVPDNPK